MRVNEGCQTQSIVKKIMWVLSPGLQKQMWPQCLAEKCPGFTLMCKLRSHWTIIDCFDRHQTQLLFFRTEAQDECVYFNSWIQPSIQQTSCWQHCMGDHSRIEISSWIKGILLLIQKNSTNVCLSMCVFSILTTVS